jgi:hypothetical protein
MPARDGTAAGRDYTRRVDDERSFTGMPALDRQEVPVRRDAAGRRLVPARVPETRPTRLGDAFIYLSIVVLVCGVVAISALEFGATLTSPLVRFPVLVGGAVLAVVTVDALVRVWRSAWAWLPVDRGRGAFRFVWAATLAGILVLTLGAMLVVARA